MFARFPVGGLAHACAGGDVSSGREIGALAALPYEPKTMRLAAPVGSSCAKLLVQHS